MSDIAIFSNEDKPTGNTTIFRSDLYLPNDEERIRQLAAKYNETCLTVDGHEKRKKQLFAVIREMKLVAAFGSDALEKSSTGHWIVVGKYVVLKVENKWKIYSKAWPTHGPKGRHYKIILYPFGSVEDLRDNYFREEFELFRNPPEDSCCYCEEKSTEEDMIMVKIWRKNGDLLNNFINKKICSSCFMDYEENFRKDLGSYPPRYGTLKDFGWSRTYKEDAQAGLQTLYQKELLGALKYNG